MIQPHSSRDRNRLTFSPEIALAICALIIGVGMAAYVYTHGLTKALTDENSHLNFARFTLDSLTPGVSQLGFWPPLLHILLLPFVAIPFLYTSGLAAAPVLIPCLMLSTVLLYQIVSRLTGRPRLGIVAAFLFLLNPYILYYSTTPMMEMLFITNLFLVAYLMLRWLETDALSYLLCAGVAVTLACLSRFEGFLLLPITLGIVLLQTLQNKLSRLQIESLIVLFGLLIGIGVTIIVTYSMAYGNSPLAFAGGSWLRDPTAAMKPAQMEIFSTFQDSIIASTYMLGRPLVILSAASVLFLSFFRRRFLRRSGVLLILVSPLFFVLVSLYFGVITINVPELAPYTIFHNDRYSLTWIGFAILAPILLLHELDIRLLLRQRFLSSLLRPVGVMLLAGLVAFSGFNFYDVVFASNYDVIRRNVNSPIPEQLQVAQYLHDHYTGGKILSARVDNDPILATAGIPLDDYIYEGNYRYFDQALAEPWFFADWVMMHNPAGSPDNWAKQNEPVYKALGTSQEFLKYYDLVLDNGQRRLFKLNENHVLLLAKERNFDPSHIPSLNPSITTWNTSTIYAEMETRPAESISPAQLVHEKAIVKSQLLDFYWDRLKPDYAGRGYFVDNLGQGNSESQGYALQQSLAVDDIETFDQVWQWTKKNLTQPDGLFAWQFSVDSVGTVVIKDPHSATDADTDIADALLKASKEWSRPQYRADALPILNGIWKQETAVATDGRHIVAGDWASASGSLILNPSYFSPAAYRVFAHEDASHDWLSLIPTGYKDLTRATQLAAKQNGGTWLPPDWTQVNASTNAVTAFSKKSNSLDYSFDAFRVFWRVAEDVLVSHDPRGVAYLKSVHVFDSEWQTSNRLCTLYLFSTSSDPCYFDMGTLAGAESVWNVTNPTRADDMVRTFSLAAGKPSLPKASTLYEKSWYWFMLWQWSHIS